MTAGKSLFDYCFSTPCPHQIHLLQSGLGHWYYRSRRQLSAELLLEGYVVHGIKRRASALTPSGLITLSRSACSDPRLVLHYGDLTDSTNLIRIIQQVQPDEIYNLGAQSHVAVSFEAPEYTANTDALGTCVFLKQWILINLKNAHLSGQY